MLTRRSLVSRAAAALALPFARTAEAAPLGELPPIPTPDMPVGEIIRGLMAWVGRDVDVIDALRASAVSAVEENADDDNDDEWRVDAMFEGLGRTPDNYDDDAIFSHGEKIRRAIRRYGYDKLPLNASLVQSRAMQAARDAEAEAEAEPVPISDDQAADDERWADGHIAALMAEFIAVMGSTRAGKLRIAGSLAGEALFQLYEGFVSDMSDEDYESHRLRLEAIEREARRRIRGEDDPAYDDQADD